jgi:hypothetical protein
MPAAEFCPGINENRRGLSPVPIAPSDVSEAVNDVPVTPSDTPEMTANPQKTHKNTIFTPFPASSGRKASGFTRPGRCAIYRLNESKEWSYLDTPEVSKLIHIIY